MGAEWWDGAGTHTHRCVYVVHSCSWSVGLAALSALWALLGMLSGHGRSSWTCFSLNLGSFWIFLLPLWLFLLLFLARIFSSTQPLRVEFVNPKFSPYFDSGYFPYLISVVPTASIFLLVHNSCVSLAKFSSSFNPMYSAVYWALHLGSPEVLPIQHVQNPTHSPLPQVWSSALTHTLDEWYHHSSL